MFNNITNTTMIPLYCFAAEDIPSYKAQKNGLGSLTNSELLSIIIGSGTKKDNAISLCQKLLADNDNSLKKLGKKDFKELVKTEGIGEKKASKILAALELSRRVREEYVKGTTDFNSALSVYNFMYPKIAHLQYEEFWVLYLNTKFSLIEAIKISQGGITETAVDVRLIMKHALLCNATVIIACHNHPSGNIKPSKNDDSVTKKLEEACKFLRIHFSDHIVLIDGNYYSYRENGRL